MLKYPLAERFKLATLSRVLNDVLEEMEDETELFERLLRSYPSRLAEVKKQDGLATKY